MWWAGSKPDDVYLGTRGFAVCQGGDKLVAQEMADLAASFAALAGWLAEGTSGRRLRMWLSGGLCRPFLVPAVPGVAGEAEWLRVASAMAPAECGLAGPCRVWLAPAQKGQVGQRVAVALQEVLLQRLLETVAAAGRKHRVICIRPWWSDVLRQAVQREPGLPLLAVQDCDAVTVLGGAGDRFDSATTLTPVFDAETAQAALARMLLTADVAPGQEMRVRLVLQGADAGGEAAPLAPLVEWSR